MRESGDGRAGHFATRNCARGFWALSAGLVLAYTPKSHAWETTLGTPTTIDSDSDRMISLRHQEHAWQTDDGALHLLVNRGSLSQAGSLTLYTTLDQGQTWAPMVTLEGTDRYSLSDGFLRGNQLWIAYSTTAGAILLSVLEYVDTGSGWSLSRTETAFSSSTSHGLNPAIAADGTGAVWCGFVAQDTTTSDATIRMIRRDPDGSGWLDAGLSFGPTDSRSVERSARPVAIPGGLGMIYTVHEVMFWAYRRDEWRPDQPWIEVPLFVASLPLNGGPFASHFSLVADRYHDLHLVLPEHGRLLYFRYLSARGLWTGRVLTRDIRAVYTQVSVTPATDAVTIYSSSEQALVRVFRSANSGNSFVFTDLLTHDPPPSGDVSYAYPRIEVPGLGSGAFPLVQQYVDGPRQRLLTFPLAGLAPE